MLQTWENSFSRRRFFLNIWSILLCQSYWLTESLSVFPRFTRKTISNRPDARYNQFDSYSDFSCTRDFTKNFSKTISDRTNTCHTHFGLPSHFNCTRANWNPTDSTVSHFICALISIWIHPSSTCYTYQWTKNNKRSISSGIFKDLFVKKCAGRIDRHGS